MDYKLELVLLPVTERLLRASLLGNIMSHNLQLRVAEINHWRRRNLHRNRGVIQSHEVVLDKTVALLFGVSDLFKDVRLIAGRSNCLKCERP